MTYGNEAATAAFTGAKVSVARSTAAIGIALASQWREFEQTNMRDFVPNKYGRDCSLGHLRIGKITWAGLRCAQCPVAKPLAFAAARKRAVNHALPVARVKSETAKPVRRKRRGKPLIQPARLAIFRTRRVTA